MTSFDNKLDDKKKPKNIKQKKNEIWPDCFDAFLPTAFFQLAWSQEKGSDPAARPPLEGRGEGGGSYETISILINLYTSFDHRLEKLKKTKTKSKQNTKPMISMHFTRRIILRRGRWRKRERRVDSVDARQCRDDIDSRDYQGEAKG